VDSVSVHPISPVANLCCNPSLKIGVVHSLGIGRCGRRSRISGEVAKRRRRKATPEHRNAPDLTGVKLLAVATDVQKKRMLHAMTTSAVALIITMDSKCEHSTASPNVPHLRQSRNITSILPNRDRWRNALRPAVRRPKTGRADARCSTKSSRRFACRGSRRDPAGCIVGRCHCSWCPRFIMLLPFIPPSLRRWTTPASVLVLTARRMGRTNRGSNRSGR